MLSLEAIGRIFMRALAGKLGRLTAYKVFRHLSWLLFAVFLILFAVSVLHVMGVQWPNFLHSWLIRSAPLLPLS
jgi:hypothetical protein